MSDAAKPESPATAEPPTAITTRFPATEQIGGGPAADRDGDIVYRPLSAFALAGFSIAALYTVVVIIGAIIAAIARTPWLMAGWTAVVPVIAIVLALVGWLQVQTSEGTRTGKKLAGWAITLSLVVSVGYWAYYAATYFVVRNQAEAFLRQYFDRIKDGELERAFILTVNPKGRPREDAGLRDAIENRFNPEAPSGKPGGGLFNVFKEHLLTHVMRQAGKDVILEPLGVSSWEFTGSGGGYVLRERYRVRAPAMVWEGVVTLKSSEPQGKSGKPRDWFVVLMETTNEPSSLTSTEDGIKYLRLQQNGTTYLSQWQGRLRSMVKSDHVESYLATLEPSQREPVADRYKKSMPSFAAAMVGTAASNPWAGFAAACGDTLAGEEQLPGYAAFARGEFVTLDKTFWPTDPQIRELALTAVRQVFHTTADMPMGVIHIDPKKIAYWTSDKDRLEFRYNVQFRVRTLNPSVEGEIVMECSPTVFETGPTAETWRVKGINLTSLRTVPGGAPGGFPGQPGPDGHMSGFAPPQ